MKRQGRMLLGIVGLAAAFCLPWGAGAQQYPAGPVKLVVGFPALVGGYSLVPRDIDRVARVFAEQLSAQLGQPVTVENVAGRGGTVAAEQVARAAPDGRTLMLANEVQLAINPTLYGEKSALAPIARVASTPLLAIVPADSPASDIKAFVELAKKSPGAYTFGSAGTGSLSHLAGELFNLKTGAKLVHTPFHLTAPIPGSGLMVDGNSLVVPGEWGLQFMLASGATVEKGIKDKKLRALAVLHDRRLPAFADVPTSAEAGLPADTVASSWMGLVAPSATPAPIVERLQKEVELALASPKVQNSLRGLGILAAFQPAGEFRATIAAEERRWGELVRASGVEPFVRVAGLGPDRVPPVATPTKVFEIRGNRAYLGGQPFKLWGIRAANALRSTAVTERHIRNFDNWNAHGLNAILVYIDGGNTGYPNPWLSHVGFGPDGALNSAVANRLEWLVREADRRGMVVGVGFYTNRTVSPDNVPDEKAPKLNAEIGKRAVQAAAKFLVDRKLNNVFIDGFHEFGNPRAGAEMFSEPDGATKKGQIVRWIKEAAPDIPCGICGATNETKREFPGMDVTIIEKDAQIHPERFTINCESARVDIYHTDGIFTDEHVDHILGTLRMYHAAPNAGLFMNAAFFQGLSNGSGSAPHAEMGGYGTADDPGGRFMFDWVRDNVGRWEYPRHVRVAK